MNPSSTVPEDHPFMLRQPVPTSDHESWKTRPHLFLSEVVGTSCSEFSEASAELLSTSLSEARIASLSVIVPVFNEEENVLPLAREIITALSSYTGRIEIIFVDDASTDGTASRLMACGLPNIRVVRHRVNAGQSAAVATGFRMATADWVATLDGDGQNDPANLMSMHATALRNKVDCVTGVRLHRKDPLIRKISSRIANGFRNFITGDKVDDSGCGIRVVRRDALAEIPVFNGMHRFLPTLLRGQGFTVIQQAVNHRERTKGVSKYGVGNRLWRGIRDCFGIRWYLSRAVPSGRNRISGHE